MMKPGKQEILAVKKVKNIIVRIMRMGRGKLMAAFVTKFAKKVKLCLTDNSSNFYPFSSAIHSSLLFELYTLPYFSVYQHSDKHYKKFSSS